MTNIIRRPLCLLCLIFMMGIWVMDLLEVPRLGEPSDNPVIQEYINTHSQVVRIYGEIYKRTPDGESVYLKNSYLQVQSNIITEQKTNQKIDQNSNQSYQSNLNQASNQKYQSGLNQFFKQNFKSNFRFISNQNINQTFNSQSSSSQQPQVVFLEHVKVYLSKAQEALPIGAGAVITGKLQQIPKASNPGQFDSVLYYKTQHIFYRMVDASAEIKQMPRYSYRETLAEIRDRYSRSIKKATGSYAPVYQAMLLGDKSQLEDEVKDRYQMAGMLHMLAISGLHLSLLGMGCFRILQRFGASIPLAGSISVFLLFSYGILTGEGVATMRALCMFVLAMGAKILGRTYDLLSALSLAAMLLLADSPYYLFYSGFQLSFGCICGIALILPCLEKIFSLKKQNPREWSWKVALSNALAGSLSIQFATLPITLYFFFEFPMYGILLNLVAIPALSAVLVSGVLGGTFGALGTWLVLPGNVLLWVYDLMGTLAQQLPMTTWVAGQPKLWQVIAYYLILAIALKVVTREKLLETWKISRRGVFFVIWVALAVGILGWRGTERLSITCLDVGQGDCIAVSTPEGHHHLIDGGSSNVQNVGRYRILPFLKSQGISRLDYVWVSHTDSDHISGILEMLQLQKEHRLSVEIVHLLMPDWRQRPEAYEELVHLAEEADVKVCFLMEGDGLREREVSWKVLSPGENEGEDVNESSLVVQLEYGEFQGMFTGDIGMDTEEKIAGKLEDVDFLKVAHHGSKNSTGELFLKKTRPEIAVISCSSTNRYGHPHPDTLARLNSSQSHIWCTKDRGATTLTIRSHQIQVQSFLTYKADCEYPLDLISQKNDGNILIPALAAGIEVCRA